MFLSEFFWKGGFAFWRELQVLSSTVAAVVVGGGHGGRFHALVSAAILANDLSAHSAEILPASRERSPENISDGQVLQQVIETLSFLHPPAKQTLSQLGSCKSSAQ